MGSSKQGYDLAASEDKIKRDTGLRAAGWAVELLGCVILCGLIWWAAK